MRGFPRHPRLSMLALGSALLLAADASFAEDPIPDLAGIYDLDGKTVVGEAGAVFVLTGKMVVRQEGRNLYTSVEARVKRVEGDTGPASLSFTSRGEASLTGNLINGISEVQTIVGQVPGVDVDGPGMPKRALHPFMAATAGRVVGEGELRFNITSDTDVFGPGADRVTTLHAVRVARKATELKKK